MKIIGKINNEEQKATRRSLYYFGLQGIATPEV